MNYTKIICELITGMVGGALLGISGFFTLMTYGGNYGCFGIIDALFGTQGYESCGAFGTLVGVLVGSLVVALAISKTSFQKNQYRKIAVISIILSFVLPLIAGVVLFGPPFEDGDLFLVPMVIITALMLSFIPSLLTTLLLNWKSFFKNKSNP